MSDAATGTTPNTGSAQTTESTAATPTGQPAEGQVTQQATEGQTGAEPVSTTQPASTEQTPAGAPDKYEFKAPDGVTYDADVIAEYSAVAKELNLPQDAAQKVLEKLAPKVAQANEARTLQAIQEQTAQWGEQLRTDKEIGGDNFDKNRATAQKAIDAFASEELRAVLRPYDKEKNPHGRGLGNHPEFVRFALKVGKALSEDRFVTGERQPTKGEKSAAAALYPNNT